MATPGRQEQAVAEQLPAHPMNLRGRPKRPQGAHRLGVLTLRVPEELFRREAAQLTFQRPSPDYVCNGEEDDYGTTVTL